jgi:hypothetical protein
MLVEHCWHGMLHASDLQLHGSIARLQPVHCCLHGLVRAVQHNLVEGDGRGVRQPPEGRKLQLASCKVAQPHCPVHQRHQRCHSCCPHSLRPQIRVASTMHLRRSHHVENDRVSS